MKELSIQGKATRYEQAIKVAQRFYNNSVATIKKELEDIFPELKESDDEKIRKSLSAYFSKFKQSDMWDDNFSFGDIVSWLEKQCEQKLPIEKLPFEMRCIGESLGFTTQEECDRYNQMVTDLIMSNDNKGEQNPADEVGNYDHKEVLQTIINEQKPAWSEEDELHIRELESLVKRVWAIAEHENDKDTIHEMSDLSFFLKTLKPQLKQEWSEEDKKMVGNIRSIIEKYAFSQSAVDVNGELCEKEYIDADNWLKSLRPQNTWKPTDEQMEALHSVIYIKELSYYGGLKDTLLSFYHQLKKLKS